jgi:hypothetical protein
MCHAQYLVCFYTMNFVCNITLTQQEVYLPVSKTYSGSITRFNRLLFFCCCCFFGVFFVAKICKFGNLIRNCHFEKLDSVLLICFGHIICSWFCDKDFFEKIRIVKNISYKMYISLLYPVEDRDIIWSLSVQLFVYPYFCLSGFRHEIVCQIWLYFMLKKFCDSRRVIILF